LWKKKLFRQLIYIYLLRFCFMGRIIFSLPCGDDKFWLMCCILPSDCFSSTAAHIPLYLYPFLNTTSKSRPFEYLRLTSLGVIGALVKVLPFWYPMSQTCDFYILYYFKVQCLNLFVVNHHSFTEQYMCGSVSHKRMIYVWLCAFIHITLCITWHKQVNIYPSKQTLYCFIDLYIEAHIFVAFGIK
jgi:hypothetical protein